MAGATSCTGRAEPSGGTGRHSRRSRSPDSVLPGSPLTGQRQVAGPCPTTTTRSMSNAAVVSRPDPSDDLMQYSTSGDLTCLVNPTEPCGCWRLHQTKKQSTARRGRFGCASPGCCHVPATDRVVALSWEKPQANAVARLTRTRQIVAVCQLFATPGNRLATDRRVVTAWDPMTLTSAPPAPVNHARGGGFSRKAHTCPL